MSQPIWNTPAGTIGTYTVGTNISYNFSATASNTSSTLVYTLLNGELPATNSPNPPMTLSPAGILSGTPGTVSLDTTSSFTIRVSEFAGINFIGLSDRTFSITVSPQALPRFTTSSGSLMTVNDSTWVDYQMLYTNPNSNDSAVVSVLYGSLPDGLEMNASGVIRGYATPPTTSSGVPTTKTSTFTLKVSNGTGFTTAQFSITVVNQETLPGYSGRNPTIFNNRPPSYFIPPEDPYSAYYISSNSIGTYISNNRIMFKIIGHDFDDDQLVYQTTGLSSIGTLSCDTNTGWITGQLPNVGPTISTYNFTASVRKLSDPTKQSSVFTYSITVQGVSSDGFIWQTDSNLGVLYNGQISTLAVKAISVNDYELSYSIVGGSLPPNLSMDFLGEIQGRLPFEIQSTIQPKDATATYTFTVRATSILYPELYTDKTFTISTVKRYVVPYDNIYIRAMPSIEDRGKLDSLLNNTAIIPTSALYRPTDVYFGKSSAIIYQHMYGVPSNLVEDYLSAVQLNHYNRQIVLGALETAQAQDVNGNVIYEVVYSRIVDDLVNKQGQSISKVVNWPRLIEGTIGQVYPASLPNMREQIADELGTTTDLEMLPRWMLSKPLNAEILGPVAAYVICYTKPGYSEIIKSNIETMWEYKLNQIPFFIDRLEVDKSLSYQYNPSTGIWSALPSSVTTTDVHDFYVYVPLNILSES